MGGETKEGNRGTKEMKGKERKKWKEMNGKGREYGRR